MKFRNTRIWVYLLVHILGVVAVMALFRFLPDRKIASVFASLVFLLSSCGVLIFELWRSSEPRRNPWIVIPTAGFLILFILPILISRWFYWELPFEEVQIFGLFSAKIWHQASNFGFMAMLALALGQGLEKQKRPSSGRF